MKTNPGDPLTWTLKMLSDTETIKLYASRRLASTNKTGGERERKK